MNKPRRLLTPDEKRGTIKPVRCCNNERYRPIMATHIKMMVATVLGGRLENKRWIKSKRNTIKPYRLRRRRCWRLNTSERSMRRNLNSRQIEVATPCRRDYPDGKTTENRISWCVLSCEESKQPSRGFFFPTNTVFPPLFQTIDCTGFSDDSI